MAASDNISRGQFQIPNAHRDAIMNAIEHLGNQGITFSPTSTDYRDETGKVHRVPVDRNSGRYLAVDPGDLKGSAYTHTLPSESIHESKVTTSSGHSAFTSNVSFAKGPHSVPHSEPGSAGKLRSKQFEQVDKSDKKAADFGRPVMGGRWSTRFNEMESDQRVLGDRSHIVNVNVIAPYREGDTEYKSDEYEYDTKTGNIGPVSAFDLTAAEAAAKNPSVNRSDESGFGRPGQHLRSFERD